jgi:hypothetical protein
MVGFPQASDWPPCRPVSFILLSPLKLEVHFAVRHLLKIQKSLDLRALVSERRE